jgi:AmmeMemoRadiSam system protein A
VRALLHLARLKGWKPRVLDYRNGGDTAGDKRSVVGYTAAAFSPETRLKTSSSPKPDSSFSSEDREWLLRLARQTLSGAVTNGPFPTVEADDVPMSARTPKGAFVTLTEHGELRGCIGNILPDAPLYRAVMQNAQSAALRDPRFAPVKDDEVKKIHIEISVLTEPEPVAFSSPDDLLTRLQPNTDGVLLRINGRGATFLPQVWEQLPDRTTFLERLSQKAGCEPGAWRGQDVTVSVYHVEAFAEPD